MKESLENSCHRQDRTVSDAQTRRHPQLVVAADRAEQQQADLGETTGVRRGEPRGERRPAVHHQQQGGRLQVRNSYCLTVNTERSSPASRQSI